MNVNTYMKGSCGDFCGFGLRENKPNSNPNKANSKPIAGLWPKIRNKLDVCGMTDHDLKKQSQFIKGQNNAKSLQAMVYGDFNGRRLLKNKANSKPNKANFKIPQTHERSGKKHKKQECQELSVVWIAGKLEFFDGFDILPMAEYVGCALHTIF